MADQKKDSNKSKYLMELHEESRTATHATILVEANIRATGRPAAGIQVKFDAGGVSVTGSLINLDAQGRGRVTIPLTSSQQVVGVRAMDSGGRAQITIKEKAAAAPTVTADDFDLRAEGNRIVPGDYAVTFACYNKQGVGVAGKRINIVTRYKIMVDDEEVTPDTKNFVFEVPAEGVTKRIRTLGRRVELDIRVVGYDKYLELPLYGPGDDKINFDEDQGTILTLLFDQCKSPGNTMLARIRGMIKRSTFAWFVTLIFMIGVAAHDPTMAVIAMLGSLLLLPLLFFWPITRFLNFFPVRVFIKTNNRWWGWMVVLTLISVVALVKTDIGKPLNKTTITNYMTDTQTAVDSEEDQMKSNLDKFGLYVLNEDLPDSMKAQVTKQTRTERPTMKQSVPKDDQRTAWNIRLSVFLTLLLLTIIYTFFAFADEIYGLRYGPEAWLREKIDGDTAQSVVKAVVKAAPVVAAVATGTTGVGEAATNVVKHRVAEYGWHVLYNWIPRVFRSRS